MSSIGDSEQDAQKRNLKNIKGVWRDTFRALKKSTTSTSGPGVDESRLSFSRRFSLGKKKHHNDSEPDETVVDPVYETLKVAAETRKMAVANYLQNRQQSLNKQVSLNSQGSSELDTQSSPKASRHASRTESEISTSLRSAAASGNRQGASSLDNARITNC